MISKRNLRASTGGVVIGATLLLLAAGGFAGHYYWRNFNKPSIENLTQRIHQDSDVVMIARGLPKLALDFRAWELAKKLQNIDNPALKQALEGLQEEQSDEKGIASSLTAGGVKLTAPLAVVVEVSENGPLGAAILPLGDEDLFRKEMKANFTNAPIEIEIQGISVLSFEDGTHLLVIKDAYAYYAYGPSLDDTSHLIDKLLDPEKAPLGEAAWWQEHQSLLDEEWELMAAISPTAVETTGSVVAAMAPPEMSAELQNSLSEDLGFTSVAFAIDFEPEHMEVLYTTTMNPESPYADERLWGERVDTLIPKIPGSLIFGVRQAYNFAGLLDLIKDSDPETGDLMNQARESIREETGIDIELDVLDKLGSPLSIAVVGDQNDETMGFGAVVWIPVNDDQVPERLEKIMGDDLEAQGVDQIAIGDKIWFATKIENQVRVAFSMDKDFIIIAAGDPLVDQIKELDKTSNSLLDSIRREEAKAYMESQGELGMYLDLKLLTNMLFSINPDEPVPAEVKTVTNALDSLTAYQERDGMLMKGSMKLYAQEEFNFADLLIELADAL